MMPGSHSGKWQTEQFLSPGSHHGLWALAVTINPAHEPKKATAISDMTISNFSVILNIYCLYLQLTLCS